MKQLELIFDGNKLFGKKLYHYTDSTGFLGIIKGKKVWATDYRFLNDPSEHIYGYNLVKEVFEELIEQKLHIRLEDIYEGIYRTPIKAASANRGYYLLSLSEDKDSLEQWRSYGNNAKGFAIEFEISTKYHGGTIDFLSDISHKLLKVIYDRAEQKRLTKEILLDAIESGFIQTFQIFFLLDYLYIKFKDPCYASEKEWRIVYSPMMSVGYNGMDIDYRESKDIIVSYHAFELEKITGVSLGPRRSESELIGIHEMLIKHLNILGGVSHSKLPYRG